jgi:hypothetical protein
MIESSRRGFLTGLIAFGVTAPAIVRATSIMPVKVFDTVNVDEMVALLARRIAEAENNMARQMAQSLYGSGATETPLEGLASAIDRRGWWKHEAQAAAVTVDAPYVRFRSYEVPVIDIEVKRQMRAKDARALARELLNG